MKLRLLLPALALLAVSATAHAFGDDDDFDPGTGPYLYVSGGAGLAYNACESTWQDYLSTYGATGTCNNKNLIYRVGFGYRFTPMWSLEANWGQFGYADQAGIGLFSIPGILGSYRWTLQANGGALQAVATVHLTTHTAVFAKFGVARVEYDEHMDVITLLAPMPPNVSKYTDFNSVHAKANVPALAVGFQIDTGPHGSIRFAAESYGSRNIYGVYGKDKPVRLVAGTISLMWRY